MTPLGQAALRLAGKGLRVFPVVVRGKEPAIKDNLKRATTDANLISGWWATHNFNIGLTTGANSGIWVLDLDDDEDEAWLRRMEAAHGALALTVEAITGKGRHLYFRWPSGTDLRNIQDRDDFPDVRANGGYVLAPPSVHPSGRAYAWSVDSTDEFTDAPDWLINAVVAANKHRATNGEIIATPPERWRSFVEDSYQGSHRGHAVARLAGLLMRKYVDPYVVLSLCQLFNMHRCQEPLTWGEVLRIVNAVANREADRREQSGEYS
jgi:hypothetical protein